MNRILALQRMRLANYSTTGESTVKSDASCCEESCSFYCN